MVKTFVTVYIIVAAYLILVSALTSFFYPSHLCNLVIPPQCPANLVQAPFCGQTCITPEKKAHILYLSDLFKKIGLPVIITSTVGYWTLAYMFLLRNKPKGKNKK